MKVTVFGVGYVGLVQGAVLADAGHDVLCVDINEQIIDDLKNGIVPIYEPGLTSLVDTNFKEGRIAFTTDAVKAVNHGELQFIAVGTPPDDDGSADLKYVLAVAETIGTHMASPKIVVDKSTVPVGTADKVKERIAKVLIERGVEFQFYVASNPEFLKEGSAISDCTKPDRIIVGTDSDTVEEAMRELYAPFNRNRDRMIFMDARSAEMTKYAANCMLATKISFMNEMSNIAEHLGADIEAVRHGIGSDSRIGYSFIYPGCGYGGSCFPKDVQALIHTAEDYGYDARILKSVESVNYDQKEKLFDRIYTHFDGNLKGKAIALWGLSFKPETDDMREAPSRVLMEALWKAGASVQAYDPEAMSECQRIYGQRDDLTLMGTAEAALKNTDALVTITEWQQFRAPDFDFIKQSLSSPVIFDGRNMYDPKRLAARGIQYHSIGR
ncbi:MAG: UDPglucose 6-dehydrogenase [Paraglaciecola sp.]|jgi:UDPglucose 6-dehydrogenase